jgi:hypothetical protein
MSKKVRIESYILEGCYASTHEKMGHSNNSSWLAKFAGVVEVPY